MTFVPDIDTDYLLADGTEAVTFTRRDDDDTAAVANAQREEVSLRGLQPFGEVVLEPDGMIWHISKAQLLNGSAAQLAPDVNDTITDGSGVVWVITQTAYAAMVEIWHLLTTKQLAGELS